VKSVTTAEGGAVTTNSDELADALRRFRNHGLVQRPEQGGWYQETVEEGFNYRLTDVQAALGRSQLRKLDRFVARRNELALRYRERLAGLPIVLPPAAPDGVTHGYHLFAIQVPERRRVYDAMRAEGIGVQVHYVPIHHHARFAGAPALPHADAAYEGLLSLPLFPALTESEQDRVIEVLSSAVDTPS
jgi:perosamine synthetase